MGQVLKIEDDEVLALAAEYAALKGEPLDAAIASALRHGIADARREHLAREKARASVAEFHAILGAAEPASDHRWMYDDAGLPAW